MAFSVTALSVQIKVIINCDVVCIEALDRYALKKKWIIFLDCCCIRRTYVCNMEVEKVKVKRDKFVVQKVLV